jgi:hypothetical protein
MSKWIDPKKRLPTKEGEYLIISNHYGSKFRVIGKWKHYPADPLRGIPEEWFWQGQNEDWVIAWRPLPYYPDLTLDND